MGYMDYSPNLVEGVFSEGGLPLYGVLRSSRHRSPGGLTSRPGRNLAVMSGTHSGTWPGRKPRTVSEQRSHRSRRTLRLRCDKRLRFPWDPSPFRGTRSAVHGSSNRTDQTPVVKAVHKLRAGAERVDAGKGSA